MKLFQMLVFTLVLFSNVRWQWTPNGYLASMIAAGVTFAATWLLVLSRDALRNLKRWLNRTEVGPAIWLAGDQRPYKGALPPALPRYYGSGRRSIGSV